MEKQLKTLLEKIDQLQKDTSVAGWYDAPIVIDGREDILVIRS